MRTYIRKLQNKPEHIRKRIMIVTLVLSMAIVSSVWIYGMGYRFSEKRNEEVANTTDASKPFALFGDSISNAYKNITASVGNVSTLGNADIEDVSLKAQKQIDLIPIEYPN